MASTASPYGLRAVNEIGGLPYAGSTRTFLMTDGGKPDMIICGGENVSPAEVEAVRRLALEHGAFAAEVNDEIGRAHV